AARGIADGDRVRVFNARGACLAGVRLDAGMLPGVVQMSTGAWSDPDGDLDRHGNPNTLTADIGTSRLTQGSSAQTAL
ncbi:MAG TPA: Asp-tRNA(Asn)/Glu-tRNA(Gln) amidotransferase GatCAB subunit C, partial [Achromobacter sp.]|nr:Asp-tRNA(Asn)/Glu-tRNA(Gln) amidotransferase GatCAB subunit C [Achromobacter sp.]